MMTEEASHRTAQNLICLIGCAVHGTIPDLTGMEDTDALYALAARHMLTAAFAMALESAGKKDGKSGLAIAGAVRRRVLFESAFARIRERLEAAGIWYLPLKGMVLKDEYPKPGMREMGDYDILIPAHRAGDVKAIMEALGYQTKSFGQLHHDGYEKPPFLRFEMHRMLFDSHDKKPHAYYRDMERRLLGDGYEKHLCPEDFYLYMTAHAYKHYTGRGTGLRTLLDTHVYLQNHPLSMPYVEAEAEKLGMAAFEKTLRTLSQRLFSGGELTEDQENMLDSILTSGTYGTVEHLVENRLREKGWGRLRYALNRFLVPVSRKNEEYSIYADTYPFFYRHRILLPLLPFFRIIRGVRTGRLQTEVRALRSAGKGHFTHPARKAKRLRGKRGH